ncbi:hypothetical protein R6Q59_010424 [Mikania micrantha]
MPNINTSLDDLLLKSDRRFDFTTGSSKSVPLTADPVETGPNISDDSEVCADRLNNTGVRGNIEERSAWRRTECSTSFRTSPFTPITDFVGRFDDIKIKPNEMSKNFNSTFVKNDIILVVEHATLPEFVCTDLLNSFMMADLRFVSDHNMSAYLRDPPAKHSMFKSLVDGLILSLVNYAIMEHPDIIADYIQSFWSSISEHTDANGTISLIRNIQGQPIVITEQILRECLQFGDKATDPVELDHDLVNRIMYQMGHEGVYPPTEKKLLLPYWRYLAHVVTQCLSGRKGGYDVLNQTLSSCLVALALGVDFNFSKIIFQDMHANIKGKRKERFLVFPRFLQIVINKRHRTLFPLLAL